MVKTFYLMRHGQTRFNVQGRIQGACDSPLTDEGLNKLRQQDGILSKKGFLLRVSIGQRKRELVTLLS